MPRPVIGIVTIWYERGAAYVSRAYREVLSEAFDVQIYTRGGERDARGDPHWDGPGVHWGPLTPDTYMVRADFEAWIRDHRVQAVLFNEQQWWPPVLWAHDLGVKTIGYVDYYTARTVRWFPLYDALLCNTRRHFSVFEQHPGACYIPWGTDLDLFRSSEREPNRAPASGHPPAARVPEGAVVFFHSAGMGGVNRRKGTDLLVEAFQRVQGPARLVIHSQVPVSAYGAAAPLIQGDPRIEFIEGTVTAPGLYHRGDVYVYPTRLEGIGLTVAEALACGLPVITTDVPPGSEIVVPEVSGWLVPFIRTRRREDGYFWPETECDILALAGVMQQCVDRKAEIPEWRRRARSFAEARLDWRRNAHGVPDRLLQLLAEPARPIPPGLRAEVVAGSVLARLSLFLQRHTVRARACLRAGRSRVVRPPCFRNQG
jgi:1,2-diacylglycerol 3-alpha-glucosyltransferase